jgi:hypothetical protein
VLVVGWRSQSKYLLLIVLDQIDLLMSLTVTTSDAQ